VDKICFGITAEHCCEKDNWYSGWAKCSQENVRYEEFVFEGIYLKYLLRVPYCTMAVSIGSNSKHITGISIFEELTGHELVRRRDSYRVNVPSAYSYFPGHKWVFEAHEEDIENEFLGKFQCCVCGKKPDSEWDLNRWVPKREESDNNLCSKQCMNRYYSAMYGTEIKTGEAEMELLFSMGKVSNHVGGK